MLSRTLHLIVASFLSLMLLWTRHCSVASFCWALKLSGTDHWLWRPLMMLCRARLFEASFCWAWCGFLAWCFWRRKQPRGSGWAESRPWTFVSRMHLRMSTFLCLYRGNFQKDFVEWLSESLCCQVSAWHTTCIGDVNWVYSFLPTGSLGKRIKREFGKWPTG